MATVVVLAVGLAWVVTPWFWVAVLFAIAGAYAMWLGLTTEQALNAFGSTGDSGGGPTGMHP